MSEKEPVDAEWVYIPVSASLLPIHPLPSSKISASVFVVLSLGVCVLATQLGLHLT